MSGGEDNGGSPQLDRRLSDLQRWRRRQAVKAGLTRLESRLFAESDIELEDLHRLVQKGCPPDLLGKVLL